MDKDTQTYWIAVEVTKEPTNETDNWQSPEDETVAGFIAHRVVDAETDDGWSVSSVSVLAARGDQA